MEVRTLGGVAQVDPESWDRLTAGAPPFLHHAFLASLEDAGCVGPGTGWHPQPLTAWRAGRLIGAAPAYVKTHSNGEFVYDWGWADAAQRSGVRYYPKLVLACPFTPVGGPRLLVDPDLNAVDRREVQRTLLAGTAEVARQLDCAGVHVLFCTAEERDLAVEMGFVARLGLQFHWANAGYSTFDDFLARFRSKRRAQIRRERRLVHRDGPIVRTYLGEEVGDELRPHAFRLYGSTVDKFHWGRRYLNEHFFELLWARMRPMLQLVLAHDGPQVVAGALNFQHQGRRYGRYWGCDADQPYLHFEVCSYASIEDCITQGVQVFEAGAGGGHHKFGRGFLPSLTHSLHLHAHEGFQDAIADFCAREAASLREQAEELGANLFCR